MLHASPAGEARLLGLKSLAALGAEKIASEALASGRASGTSHVGPLVISKIGADASAVLLASFEQAVQPSVDIPTEPAAPIAPTPESFSPPAAPLPPAASGLHG